MTAILDRRIDRRDFIVRGLGALGTLVTLGGCHSPGTRQGPLDRRECRWALLSDTHIPRDMDDNYRGFYPYRNLQQIVPQLIAAEPEAIAITGDLARLTGQPGDYANLKKLLAPLAENAPVFMALGNHDDRDNFLKTFNELLPQSQPVSGKYVVVANTPPVRLVMLDSLLYVNKVPGLLGKAQRSWLAEFLDNDDQTATILCFHHTLGDGDGDLLDLPRLYDLIEPVRKVKALVYGHSHEYGFSEYAGIHQINLPATGYNFNDAEPVGWVEARLTARGGQFMLHATAGNKSRDRSVKRLTWRT